MDRFFPLITGSGCTARQCHTPCTYEWVNVGLVTPSGRRAMFPCGRCKDCHEVWQLPAHAYTHDVDSYVLSRGNALVPKACVDSCITYSIVRKPTMPPMDHYCTMFTKFKDVNQVPHFRCLHCTTCYPWNISFWAFFDKVPQTSVHIQMISNMINMQTIGLTRDINHKLPRIKCIQHWFRKRLVAYSSMQDAAKQWMMATSANKIRTWFFSRKLVGVLALRRKLKQTAAMHIHRFMYKIMIRCKKHRIGRAMLTLQRMFRHKRAKRSIYLHKKADTHCLRTKWKAFVLAVKQHKRIGTCATMIQRSMKKYIQRIRHERMAASAKAASCLSRVWNSVLVHSAFSALKAAYMTPKHAAARVIQATFSCFCLRRRQAKKDMQKKERRKAKRKRQRLNQKKKRDELGKALDAAPVTDVSDERIKAVVYMMNSFLEMLQASNPLSTNTKVFVYTTCKRATDILARFMKKDVYTSPPFRLTQGVVLGFRNAIANAHKISDEEKCKLDNVAMNFIRCSLVLKRTQQVIQCIIPSSLVLALCHKGRVPIFDVMVSYWIQLVLHMTRTACMTRAFITRDVQAASELLIHPTMGQFAGATKGEKDFVYPTMISEMLDDMSTPCDPLCQMVKEIYEVGLDAVTSGMDMVTPFFFLESRVLVKNMEDLHVVSSTVTMAKMFANSLYMLCSDFNQGFEYPSIQVGKRLRTLAESIPQWQSNKETLWDACVNFECVHTSLRNPETNRRYKRCQNRLKIINMEQVQPLVHQYAQAFGTMYSCDPSKAEQQMLAKCRNLEATLRIGHKRGGKDVDCIFLASSYHLDAVLMACHLTFVDIFKRGLLGTVAQKLLVILCGVQRILNVELHPITGEPKINAFALPSDDDPSGINTNTSQFRPVFSFWHNHMGTLLRISSTFFDMIESFTPSKKTTKDQSIASITERNRMDLQVTTIVLRFTQLLLREIRFSTKIHAMYFLFTVACVILDQPEHVVRIHSHMERTFFPSTCQLSDFFSGFFEIHVEQQSQSYKDGKMFMAKVRTILAFDI